MDEQKHIISRQVLEITVQNRQQAHSIQNAASSAVRQKLLPALDRTFSRLTKPDEILRLDKLVLDIGDVSSVNLEEELTSRVLREIEEKLSGIISKEKVKSTEREDGRQAVFIKKPDRYADQLMHYLKFGVMPWWRDESSGITLAELIRLAAEESEKVATELIPTLLAFRQVRKRIAYQLNRAQLMSLLSLLPGQAGGQTKKFDRIYRPQTLFRNVATDAEWQYHLLDTLHQNREFNAEQHGMALISVIIRKSLHDSSRLTREVVLTELIGNLVASGIMKSLKKEILFETAKLAKELQVQLTKQTLPVLRSYINEMEPDTQRIFRDLVSLPPETGSPGPADEQVESPIFSGHSERKEEEEEAARAGKKSTASDQIQEKVKGITPSKDWHPVPVEEEKDIARDVDQKRFSIPLDDTGFYIENAGIILLHPFLFYLFDGLDLLNEDKIFKSEQEAFRAVHLLQYLATGQVISPEHELMLNKILCGLDPAEPVPLEIGITEEEQAECMNLLTVVLERWEALKTRKPDALRQNFLNRSGRLSYRGNGWNLYIERSTLDVMLDKLPWSLSIVKIPWRDDLIYVEW